eukprot:COSAG04_NODE_70_length_29153_cov_152.225683_13_plen_198_part_00
MIVLPHPPTLIRNGAHIGVLHDIAHGKVVINDEPGKCTLEQLGDFTGAVGEILVRRVAAAPGCKLLPQSKVRQLRIMSANESSLVIDIAGCSTVTAQVGSVVLATGAPSTACTSKWRSLFTTPSEVLKASCRTAASTRSPPRSRTPRASRSHASPRKASAASAPRCSPPTWRSARLALSGYARRWPRWSRRRSDGSR